MARHLSKKILTQVQTFFDHNDGNVYGSRALTEIFNSHRQVWQLPWDLTYRAFLEGLLGQTQMRRFSLQSAQYGSVTRFAWGDVSDYEVALSIRPNSFLTHGTAVFLHALTDQVPSIVYVNKEQGDKPEGTGVSQATIDRAFARPQRRSNYLLRYGNVRILLVSGKATGRLGVVPFTLPNSAVVQVTSIERTLIDLVVRPAYAGGVFEVLKVFRAARDRASLPLLLGMLRQLNYSYPYHQVLGFYMEVSGYPVPAVNELRSLGMQFDFYLAHGIGDKVYVPAWRLFIPRGFPTAAQS